MFLQLTDNQIIESKLIQINKKKNSIYIYSIGKCRTFAS